jgi:FkbM family methyltransferase
MSEPFNHHPLFRDFHPYEGWSEPGFEPWHFGAQFRDWLFTGKSKGYTERRMVSIGHPEPTEEYFEWIALLSAVAATERHFRMFELGAGWGRWSIAAAMLCRQRHLPFHLVAVEPEPAHFQWLQMAFRDNGLDPSEHDLREAAVVPEGRTARLAGVNNEHHYDHYVALGIGGFLRRLRGKHSVRKVNVVSLRELLETYPSVDLIDMDIQGMEVKNLACVSREQLQNTRIIHIGTHSRKNEAELKEIFGSMGWLNAFSFPCFSETKTPFGVVKFIADGVQTWVNPAAAAVMQRINPP